MTVRIGSVAAENVMSMNIRTPSPYRLVTAPKVFSFNPFPNDEYFTLPISNLWQTTILDLMKMASSSPNR